MHCDPSIGDFRLQQPENLMDEARRILMGQISFLGRGKGAERMNRAERRRLERERANESRINARGENYRVLSGPPTCPRCGRTLLRTDTGGSFCPCAFFSDYNAQTESSALVDYHNGAGNQDVQEEEIPFPKGKCSLCGQKFLFSEIVTHIESCEIAKCGTSADPVPSSKRENSFIIAVKGSGHLSAYWMCVEADPNSTLSDLDRFLRDTWVDCCGHLSLFKIGGTTYAYMPDPKFHDRSMNVKLSFVLRNGAEFGYEYDFGTTTALALKVSTHENVLTHASNKTTTRILARNDPPDVSCGNCGKNLARSVCADCVWDGNQEAWLCEDCSKTHKCGEDMLLPVVNSPRVGMCGYTGR